MNICTRGRWHSTNATTITYRPVVSALPHGRNAGSSRPRPKSFWPTPLPSRCQPVPCWAITPDIGAVPSLPPVSSWFPLQAKPRHPSSLPRTSATKGPTRLGPAAALAKQSLINEALHRPQINPSDEPIWALSGLSPARSSWKSVAER